MESVLFPSLLLVAAYPRSGSPQHEWMQSPPMPSGTSTPFSVRLSPELEAVPPGGSVWLNCSHSCPLPVRSSLRTQLRQGKTLHGSGWVSYQLLDVRAWNSKVRCVVTCAGETREATARITAYSLTLLALERPRSVIMEPPVLVGHKYTLRCYVTHVFPVGFLVVSLRRGGRVIYFESLERFTGSDLANVTLTYVMRAGPNDLWQPITCHARLNLDGLVVRSSSAPVMLTVLALSPASKALASASIAAMVGILLAVGVVYVRKYQAVQTQL
ncbi:intercellular adhesion molecule 4 isoform X1 [Cricetulus griseus]|uniref:Intercellular adhesion molecule 4 n=1 Tax=Cricetulus griseus TaxID=10029 RepID=A0A9J7JFM2_CRIGR|nr:intercellular adhesion molecule 4 isoform X1 [Cricetulus griseus]XP_027267280.1 intercellular adhesion molecule 4 isoform X1 [Cricetulus griseus]